MHENHKKFMCIWQQKTVLKPLEQNANKSNMRETCNFCAWDRENAREWASDWSMFRNRNTFGRLYCTVIAEIFDAVSHHWSASSRILYGELVNWTIVMFSKRTRNEHQSFFSDSLLKIENNAWLLSVQVKNNDINFGKMTRYIGHPHHWTSYQLKSSSSVNVGFCGNSPIVRHYIAVLFEHTLTHIMAIFTNETWFQECWFFHKFLSIYAW